MMDFALSPSVSTTENECRSKAGTLVVFHIGTKCLAIVPKMNCLGRAYPLN
jgi:hypothetical protein